MRRLTVATVIAAGVLVGADAFPWALRVWRLTPGVEAQAPAPPSCEEQATTLRILADQLAAGRQRAEVEGAQAIARMLHRMKALEAENAALKQAAKPAKETQ